jgi:UDP-2,3-diacylglucosamine hydrolase
MQRCFFTSDFHLFASRSLGMAAWDQVLVVSRQASLFVLGGDIFDFRWATMRTIQEAVQEATDLLGDLLRKRPGCQFHYVLGNHDYHRDFLKSLAELAATTGNLSWHRFLLRLGRCVFLHGDVADRKMDARRFAASRDRWLDESKRGRVLNALYDAAVAARIHKPVPMLFHRRRTVAARILSYLREAGQGPQQGVRHVYFGHIHRPFSDYQYNGLTFHNCGGAIKGLKHRILEADVA